MNAEPKISEVDLGTQTSVSELHLTNSQLSMEISPSESITEWSSLKLENAFFPNLQTQWHTTTEDFIPVLCGPWWSSEAIFFCCVHLLPVLIIFDWLNPLDDNLSILFVKFPLNASVSFPFLWLCLFDNSFGDVDPEFDSLISVKVSLIQKVLMSFRVIKGIIISLLVNRPNALSLC